MTEDKVRKLERSTYTITEAAELLRISRAKCYDLIEKGELPTLTMGTRRLVTKASLEKYVLRVEAAGESSYTIYEAAYILGVSASLLRRQLAAGRIQHYRIGSVIRIPKIAIEALLESA